MTASLFRPDLRPEDRIIRDELVLAHREHTRLRLQSEQLIASNRDLSGLLLAAERRTNEMLKMTVAIRRLADARDTQDGLRILEEILINVVGTEDFAILAVSPDGIVAVGGMGPLYETTQARVQFADSLRDCVNSERGSMSATRTLSPGRDSAGDIAACVPLRLSERTVGAIVIQKLLPHREPINAFDDELLRVLGDLAATFVIAAEQRPFWTTLVWQAP